MKKICVIGCMIMMLLIFVSCQKENLQKPIFFCRIRNDKLNRLIEANIKESKIGRKRIECNSII